jgi:hypothetical protein
MKKEKEKGYDEVFVKPGTNTNANNAANNDTGENPVGRPTMEDGERESDPGHSETGRQNKPSRPEGSEKQEE